MTVEARKPGSEAAAQVPRKPLVVPRSSDKPAGNRLSNSAASKPRESKEDANNGSSSADPEKESAEKAQEAAKHVSPSQEARAALEKRVRQAKYSSAAHVDLARERTDEQRKEFEKFVKGTIVRCLLSDSNWLLWPW